MLPVNSGGHPAYQDFVVTNLCKYSLFGPKPRTPSCMQRSYLLAIDFKVTSLTEWAAQLKINPLFAILSGFEFGDTPGGGTFYDFPSRLWDSDAPHLSSHIHPLKGKVKKPKKKDTKADSIEKVTAIFPSLTVTSDGILPETSAIMATICICWLHPIQKMFCLYFLNRASMHNSHGFLHNFFRMKNFLPDYNVAKLLLDSAHDAMPYYEYCRHQNITPFIGQNGKGGVKPPYKNDFIIGKDGGPVCKEGRPMNQDGSEPSKHRIKFRCPLTSRK